MEISVGEDLVYRALELEFGCRIERNAMIPAGGRWLNCDGAVVRGEELVAFYIGRFNGRGFPIFQVDHFAEIGLAMRFDRFTGFSLVVAVVSEATEKEDAELKRRLEAAASAAPCDVSYCVFRINPLKARFGI